MGSGDEEGCSGLWNNMSELVGTHASDRCWRRIDWCVWCTRSIGLPVQKVLGTDATHALKEGCSEGLAGHVIGMNSYKSIHLELYRGGPDGFGLHDIHDRMTWAVAKVGLHGTCNLQHLAVYHHCSSDRQGMAMRQRTLRHFFSINQYALLVKSILKHLTPKAGLERFDCVSLLLAHLPHW